MARKATSRTATTTAAAGRKAGATKAPAAKGAATRAAATTKEAPAGTATKRAAAAKDTRSSAAKKAAPAKTPRAKKAAPATKAAAKKAAPATKKAAPARAKAKAAPGRKATRGRGAARSPFSAAFLDAQREALREERATYLGQAETLQAEAEALVADVDPGDVQFDEESGEGDTLAVERERDLALSAQARQAVEEIDHALEKLEQGTYGLCEVDQEPIPEERLEAIPWARTCVQHKIGGFGRR